MDKPAQRDPDFRSDEAFPIEDTPSAEALKCVQICPKWFFWQAPERNPSFAKLLQTAVHDSLIRDPNLSIVREKSRQRVLCFFF